MDPLVSLILKEGLLGLLAGVGFYLFFMERKEVRRLVQEKENTSKTYLDAMIQDTQAKTQLLKTVDTLTDTVGEFWKQANGVWSKESEARARDEGRWEATNPHLRIPQQGDDDGQT